MSDHYLQVGWVERSATHLSAKIFQNRRWVALRSTHLTNKSALTEMFQVKE